MAISLDALQQEYGPNSMYEAKLRQFADDKFYDKMAELTHKTGPYSVINHGDCWVPNFLINHNTDGSPCNTKIIDFQLARYTSPALDISFFIYSGTSKELREQHYDELITVGFHAFSC